MKLTTEELARAAKLIHAHAHQTHKIADDIRNALTNLKEIPGEQKDRLLDYADKLYEEMNSDVALVNKIKAIISGREHE